MIVDAALERATGVPLEEALQELAGQMREYLLPEQRARLMNMAGDLCYDAGQRERALLYFDAAIDLYISSGRFAASAALCEKLVRLNPRIVRARCTLAWLAIARGLDDEAVCRVDEYVDAALRQERPTVAQRQLRGMAEEADSEMVLEAIAHGLRRLSDVGSAERILASALSPAARETIVKRSPEDRNRAIIFRLTHAWGG